MDALGYRKKIGLVIASVNTSAQPESDDLRVPGVTNHTARISIEERPLNSDEAFMAHVEAMRSGIRTAIAQVMTCAPDHIIMGIALEAFWGGVNQSEALRRDLVAMAGVGVSMGSNATVAALQAYEAKKIAILTPHMPRGDAMVRLYFEEAGFDVVALKGLKCPSPRQIAHTTYEQLRDGFLEINSDDVDVLVQVGTNLAGKQVAADAERWLDKPVLSMNVVTYWHALRELGIKDKIYGQGRILEDF